MHEPTSVLFGLDGFRVMDVECVDDHLVRVVVETVDRYGACLGCGQVSSRVKQRPRVQIKDLPVGESRVDLWWRKRRLVCVNPQCGRGSFTQTMPQITTVAADQPAAGQGGVRDRGVESGAGRGRRRRL